MLLYSIEAQRDFVGGMVSERYWNDRLRVKRKRYKRGLYNMATTTAKLLAGLPLFSSIKVQFGRNAFNCEKRAALFWVKVSTIFAFGLGGRAVRLTRPCGPA